jgi:hypothetical protein
MHVPLSDKLPVWTGVIHHSHTLALRQHFQPQFSINRQDSSINSTTSSHTLEWECDALMRAGQEAVQMSIL